MWLRLAYDQSRIETAISADRLTAYKTASGQDSDLALRLYAWNIALSSSLWGPLHGLEVALRNAMHRELSQLFGTAWMFNNAIGLAPEAMNRIQLAKNSLLRGNYPIDPPHMLAELPFGFWVSLLGHGPRGQSNYEMLLWRPGLYKAFPNIRQSRPATHRPLDKLRGLRNRIAHHEPIFQRPLDREYETILLVAGWIDSDVQAWISTHSRFPRILGKYDPRTRLGRLLGDWFPRF